MKNTYRINIFRAGYFLAMVCFVFALAFIIFIILTMFHHHAPPLLIYLAETLLVITLFFCYLTFFYFPKLEIDIDGGNLVYKMPDKTISISIKNIFKIRKSYSFNGVEYSLHFNDENNKKKCVSFTQDLEDAENLIEYIQKVSGTKIGMAGMLDVENEKRPYIKILKMVFNFIIVCVAVAYLYLHFFLAFRK